MEPLTFITGNQDKAEFLAKHLGHKIEHQKLDLDEIQSMDLKTVAEHKVQAAYELINKPSLVEDVSFSMPALGGLPGPFIKWFEIVIGLDGICKLADDIDDRRVTIAVCFALYDGHRTTSFTGELNGTIADAPRGTNGFGFDPIFIRDGFDKTFAEMTNEELEKYSLRTSTVYPQMKEYFKSLDRGKA